MGLGSENEILCQSSLSLSEVLAFPPPCPGQSSLSLSLHVPPSLSLALGWERFRFRLPCKWTTFPMMMMMMMMMFRVSVFNVGGATYARDGGRQTRKKSDIFSARKICAYSFSLHFSPSEPWPRLRTSAGPRPRTSAGARSRGCGMRPSRRRR